MRFQPKWRSSLFGNKKWGGSSSYRPGYGYGVLAMPSQFQLPGSSYQFSDQLNQGIPFSQNIALPGASSYTNDGWSVPLSITPGSLQQSQVSQYDNYNSQPLLHPVKPQSSTTTVIDSYGGIKGGGSASTKQQYGTTKK